MSNMKNIEKKLSDFANQLAADSIILQTTKQIKEVEIGIDAISHVMANRENLLTNNDPNLAVVAKELYHAVQLYHKNHEILMAIAREYTQKLLESKQE